MTRPAVRVVAASDPPSSIEMREAIESEVNQMLAKSPVAVVIIYEMAPTAEGSSTEAEATFICRSVPNSVSLRRGMISLVFDQYFPSGDTD